MQNQTLNLNKSLQAKYPHLELSVLSLSQVQKDNESSRIDSEYFKKEYLENEAMLLNLNCEILGQITEKICNGSTPENGEFENQGIPFFRSQDFDLLDTDPKQYVKQEFHNTLSRSKVKYKDILIAIIGATLGKIGFVKENIVEANINQNIAKVSIKNEEFNPYFVATFLDTYYGQYQIFRLATQTAQEYLNNIQVAKIKVPKFSQDFQLEIQHLVQDSHKALEDSKALYKEAENLLYESLGLDSSLCHTNAPLRHTERSEVSKNAICHTEGEARSISNNFKRDISLNAQYDKDRDSSLVSLAQNDNIERIACKYPHLNLSIRSLSQSYGVSGRLDSEYYQTKYDAIESKIKGYNGGWEYVKAMFSHNNTTCDFSKDKYNYIEISDINTSNGEASYNQIQTDELPANAKIVIAKNDILISKVRPYRGAVAIIDFEVKDIVASGAFVVLRENGNFKKEVLQVLLRTAIYKEWLLKWNVGTSYPVIKDDDILNLPIPKIATATQEQIASKIQKSFALRAKSKSLLESAKSKVEQNIQNRANQP